VTEDNQWFLFVSLIKIQICNNGFVVFTINWKVF